MSLHKKTLTSNLFNNLVNQNTLIDVPKYNKDIEVFLPILNVNFTYEDGNRIMFFNEYDWKTNYSQLSKDEYITQAVSKWEYKHFKDDKTKIISYIENNALQSTITIPLKDTDNLESFRVMNYMKVKIQNSIKYFFIDNVVFPNNDSVVFYITLDSITTYLHLAEFTTNNLVKIDRRHENRYVFSTVDNRKVNYNFAINSIIWNIDNSIVVENKILDNFNGSILDKSEIINRITSYNGYFNFGTGAKPLYVYALVKTRTPEAGNTSNTPKTQYQGRGESNDLANINTGFGIRQHIIPLSKFSISTVDGTDNGNTLKLDGLDGNHIQSDLFVEFAELNTLFTSTVPLAIEQEQFRTDLKVSDIFANTKGNLGAQKIITLDVDNFMNSYKYDVNFNNPLKPFIKPNINSVWRYNEEPKLFSEEHYEMYFKSITQQQFKYRQKLAQQDSIETNNNKINLKLEIALLPTQMKEIWNINSYNSSYTYDASNVFIVDKFESLPSLSSPYLNFINSHLASFKNGVMVNQLKATSGVLAGAGLGIAGGATGNFALAGAGVAGASSALMSGILAQKGFDAQITDLKNTPSTVKGTSFDLANDFIQRKYMDLENDMGLYVYTPALEQKKNIGLHYHKYGYNSNEKLNIDYFKLQTRNNFNYWQIPMFSNALKKVNIPTQALNEINEHFREGMTLWNAEWEINNYTIINLENNML